MLIFKDKSGREFAYPVGIEEARIPLKATEASEVISDFPPYLREGIKRVSFYDIPNPNDPYWKWAYNNPDHVSAMSDGGQSDIWMPMTKDAFRGYMSHEAGHILDKAHNVSASAAWTAAVDADLAMWGKHPEWGYVSKYARTNPREDFAESMKAYITDHDNFKKFFPNRAAYIRAFAKSISTR